MSAWNDEQLFSSARTEETQEKDEWMTPPEIFCPLYDEFRYDVDGAASMSSCLVPEYLGLDIGVNALQVDWREYGTRFWFNPPYSLAHEFLERASWFAANSDLLMTFLVFSRTETEWWWRFVLGRDPETKERIPGVPCADEIRWHPKRIRFLDPETQQPRKSPKTGQVQSAPAPSVLIVFDPSNPRGARIARDWPRNGVF